MGWLVIGGVGFVFAVLGQTLILRLRAIRNGMVAFLMAGVPSGLAVMALLFPRYPEAYAVAGTLLYAFLCELWMFAFSSTFSSVAATLLLYLYSQPMGQAEIDRFYDNRVLIKRRIGWLIHIGAVRQAEGGLFPTAAGRRLAAVFDAFRGFFGHR